MAADADIEIARLVDRLMRRIHAGLNAKAATFDRHRVGAGGGVMLLTLAEIEPAAIQTLVHRLRRDKSQISREVQTLERKGLIARAACPEDARVSILTLTPEGRETVGVLQRAVADVLSEILAPLSAADQRHLKTLLSQV